MSILIKNAKIIHPGSKLHNAKRDILINNGVIEKIAARINAPKAKVIKSKNLHISAGWLDLGTQCGEPGFEHRENFDSLSRAAASGGFTGVALFPNTNPTIDDKSSLQFVLNSTKDHVIQFYPIGALSKNCEGRIITEMIDMAHCGAVAFSDGRISVSSNGLLLRALQYVKSVDGMIIHRPDDPSLSNGNNIHEGEVSTSLGLKASPSLSENLTLERDILMADYADSKLLLHSISTKESVIKLENGKAKNIYSSVSYLHLCKNDQSLSQFDVNHKVNPPLRSKEDQDALINGVKKGTIDIICSNHDPLEEELKKKEFVYAELGATGLQTCFSALADQRDIKLDTLIKALSSNPRKILNIDNIEIKEGEEANLTLFDLDSPWKMDEKSNQSKSKNSPYWEYQFKSKVVGIINGKKSYFNKY